MKTKPLHFPCASASSIIKEPQSGIVWVRIPGREARIKMALFFGVCVSVCVCLPLSPYTDKTHVDMFPKEIRLKVFQEDNTHQQFPSFDSSCLSSSRWSSYNNAHILSYITSCNMHNAFKWQHTSLLNEPKHPRSAYCTQHWLISEDVLFTEVQFLAVTHYWLSQWSVLFRELGVTLVHVTQTRHNEGTEHCSQKWSCVMNIVFSKLTHAMPHQNRRLSR